MIYSFLDYRSWLKSELDEKTKDNPLYSASAFARRLGVSQAYLSLVLAGKRRLTEEMAEKIGRSLQLSETELRYLILLIKSEQHSEIPELKLLFEQQIKKLRLELRITPLGLEQFKVLSDWYHSALLELIQIPYLDHNPIRLADRLGIPEDLAKDALDRLCSLDLVEKTPNGFR